MAELSRFYGIVISIFFRGEVGRHNLPHFHVRHGEWRASVGLDGEVLAGELPPTARQIVRQWVRLHRDDLDVAWERARAGRPPGRIEPLP